MSKRAHHEEHEEHPDESWLIPYADLLTLLLALFIVLYASSQVDQEKFDAMAAAFRTELYGEQAGGGDSTGVQPGGSGILNPDDGNGLPSFSPINTDEMMSLLSLQAELKTYFKDQGLEGSVQTFIDDRGLVLRLSNAILFAPGSAALKPEYEETMVKIGETLRSMKNYIRVEGHTDNVPTNPLQYPTNWELSSARATSVIRIFISNVGISPEKLVAVGYAEFKPVESNDTPEGRAANRRIDIIVLNTKYNDLEDQLEDITPVEVPSTSVSP